MPALKVEISESGLAAKEATAASPEPAPGSTKTSCAWSTRAPQATPRAHRPDIRLNMIQGPLLLSDAAGKSLRADHRALANRRSLYSWQRISGTKNKGEPKLPRYFA